MISATKRWFRRNRKGLAIGAGVIGAGYLAGQYVLGKISEATERMGSDRIARENLRRRFEQNQTDCTYTVLALLPTAAEDILEALPVEELTKELQKKRAERLARLGTAEGTSSDLSSISPSITDDDRRSLSSFQSDGFVRASQLGESTLEGAAPSPSPKRNKTQLWNEVKITSITRSFTLIYTLSLLTIFTRIQLNLLGRRNYLSSVISMATLPADASTIRLEDHDDDDLTQTLGNDFETNRRYLAFSWWLLHRGWKQLMEEVQSAVTEVFGSCNPREDISRGKLAELTLQVRRKVEGDTEEDRKEEEDHLLEESGVLGVTEPYSPQTTATLRHLLDETADLIDSPTFTRVVLLLNNECFETLIQQCATEAFKSSHMPAPQSFTSVATVIPAAVSSEPKTKLANVLAVLARQAHVIGNGTAPPNLYLNAMEQGVRELEAFAAVSPYFAEMKTEEQIQTSAAGLPPLTSTTERKLTAKIDWHIVPCLCIMYLLAFLDRVNISNAAVLGLQKDLNIVTGTKYNTALTIFFVPYVLFEIPSNLLLKKLKPHVWLSLCMFGFGLVMICQGLVTSWGGLVTTRWFLGTIALMFVAGFYLLGTWYKRSEAQKRFSFFFSSTTLAGAFGGLLASGLGKMAGLRGYGGWQWVFIIEGVLTCVVSFVWYFIIPGFPEDVKWINDEERRYIQAKLAQDVGKAGHNAHIGFREVLDVFKDCKFRVNQVSMGADCNMVCLLCTVYHQDLWIRRYTIQTQLYSIPPWAAAFVFSMLIAILSDKFKHRFAFTLIPMLVTMAGYGILLNVHGVAHRNVQYGALFMVTCGTYSAMPVIVCWYAMNLGGHRRRSVGTAWQIGFGNIGGFISTYAFLAKDAPLYRNGYIISLSFQCFSAACCIFYFAAIWAANKRRDRIMARNTQSTLLEDEEEIEGDLAVTYRYAY
ncbi:putative MFS transporter [Aspergillus violaceofuscus CBS 115571]|uniref:Putative MFS transporter n=1 Tax=Aspergillus violaceofuscus (strain CBS 115571) TaxID=1450538 RepID=A0A2V5HCX9_ASPV1|nr:putative MFS transporter [Aspergillus violaceofuscus CBS 115571]